MSYTKKKGTPLESNRRLLEDIENVRIPGFNVTSFTSCSILQKHFGKEGNYFQQTPQNADVGKCNGSPVCKGGNLSGLLAWVVCGGGGGSGDDDVLSWVWVTGIHQDCPSYAGHPIF